MVISNINTTLNADVQTVWDIVTSLENYAWRSDLSSIEVMSDGKKFVEKTARSVCQIFTPIFGEVFSI